MLTDISNNLRVHNNDAGNINSNALRPLKIVNRRSTNNRTTDENIHQQKNIKRFNNNSRQQIPLQTPINTNKILDAPNYKFPKVYKQTTDTIFPFYECPVDTENKFLKNNEPKLDFTSDISIHKNPIKKYAYPVKVNCGTALNTIYRSTANANTSSKSNIFFGFNTDLVQDPIMETFIHMKSENMLRFGEYVLTVGTDGCVEFEHSPIKEEELVIRKRINNSEEHEDDEVLYNSDEGEVSRLENSDLDITESEDSDVEIELELDLTEEDDEEVDSSLIDSSLVSQGIPPCTLDSLHDGFLTNDKQQQINDLSLSPLKRAMINNTANNMMLRMSSSPSPQKQQEQLLFRTLKNKSSPIKALQSQRSGINLQQIAKPVRKNNKHTNYSKWDNSMTISAKAIMKMVDDSLVSSDTEMYNHSYSYIKSFNRGSMNNNASAFKDDFNINANDLMDALNDVSETPLIRRMQDLKL